LLTSGVFNNAQSSLNESLIISLTLTMLQCSFNTLSVDSNTGDFAAYNTRSPVLEQQKWEELQWSAASWFSQIPPVDLVMCRCWKTTRNYKSQHKPYQHNNTK